MHKPQQQMHSSKHIHQTYAALEQTDICAPWNYSIVPPTLEKKKTALGCKTKAFSWHNNTRVRKDIFSYMAE